jgi:hypothetical protein
MEPYTLPEIIIEGRPDSPIVNVADWFAVGYMAGWNQPDFIPQAPEELRSGGSEDLLSAYFDGVTSGQQDRRSFDEAFAGPAVVPDLGGEPYEELERRWREAWSEFLNHREEPHIEPPGIEFVPRGGGRYEPPGIEFVPRGGGR